MDTAFLAGLQIYFIIMNWTVERSYCSAPIEETSDASLPGDDEFCTAHNLLFLARPEVAFGHLLQLARSALVLGHTRHAPRRGENSALPFYSSPERSSMR